MILIYLVFADPIKGQQVNFNSIDSLSYQLYLKGAWDSLLQLGKLAEKADIVYPNLSLRLGYAAFMKGNNSLSLKHFNYVLKENSFNQNALYYAVLNNKLLSRNEAAAFRSKNLDEDLKKPLNIGYKKLAESIDVETSFKPTNSEVRKMGKFYRIGVSNRINYRWKLNHSVSSFQQNLLTPTDTRTTNQQNRNNNPTNFRKFNVNDFQYYLKSDVFLNENFLLTNAYHMIYTHFDNSTYSTNIISTGLKYFTPFADFKMEINTGLMLDSLQTQLAFSSTYHPKGNLDIYGNSRVSYQKRTNLTQLNFSQVIGLKLSKKIWVEMHGTFGQIKNFIDNDAFYIYDAIDAGNFRIGTSFIIAFNNHISLLSNYYYEQKRLYSQNTNYHLHSYSLGLTWKL